MPGNLAACTTAVRRSPAALPTSEVSGALREVLRYPQGISLIAGLQFCSEPFSRNCRGVKRSVPQFGNLQRAMRETFITFDARSNQRDNNEHCLRAFSRRPWLKRAAHNTGLGSFRYFRSGVARLSRKPRDARWSFGAARRHQQLFPGSIMTLPVVSEHRDFCGCLSSSARFRPTYESPPLGTRTRAPYTSRSPPAIHARRVDPVYRRS